MYSASTKYTCTTKWSSYWIWAPYTINIKDCYVNYQDLKITSKQIIYHLYRPNQWSKFNVRLKTAYLCLLCRNYWQLPSAVISSAGYCVRVPEITSKLKNKRLPVGTTCSSSFIFCNGRLIMSEQTKNDETAQKNSERHVFMLFTDQCKKSVPSVVQYCRLHVFYSI